VSTDSSKERSIDCEQAIERPCVAQYVTPCPNHGKAQVELVLKDAAQDIMLTFGKRRRHNGDRVIGIVSDGLIRRGSPSLLIER
jgi:hypothetical protein